MSYSVNSETLVATYNGQEFGPKGIDGKKIALTEQECIEQLAIQTEEVTWNTANKYKVDRASAYPPIADQLDQIYHEGIDAWKETIAAVKAEYPKPEAN